MARQWTRPVAWCAAGVLAVVINPTAPRAADPLPPTKKRVELPTERVVASTAPAAPVNPTVAPGLVNWHPSIDAACTAAKKSSKPVLVFHMMGQLDKQFC